MKLRALLVAGKKIRKLTFGWADTPILKLLRRVLREARTVAAADKEKHGGRSSHPKQGFGAIL